MRVKRAEAAVPVHIEHSAPLILVDDNRHEGLISTWPDHSFAVVFRHDSSKLAPVLWRSTDPAHDLPELTALLEEQHRAGVQRTTQGLEQWRKGLSESKLVEADVPESGDCLDASVTGEDVHSGDVKPIAHRHREYEPPGEGGTRNAEDHPDSER